MATIYKPYTGSVIHMSEKAAREWDEIQNRSGANTSSQMGPQKSERSTNTPLITKSQMNGTTAVRDYMVNKLKMDNSKIGYNNGAVTYNGQAFLTPSSIENNRSYASEADINNAYNSYRTNNSTVPLRELLTQNGYINDYIGYNNGNVTYRGNNVIAPGKIENGVSYVTQEEADNILNSLSQGVVNAADYMASLGYKDGVTWNNNNTVTVLGTQIPVQRIVSNGTNTIAQVSKADINRAIVSFNEDKPTFERAYDKWSRYEPAIERALNDVLNQEEFSYSLEDDINYQAAKAAAERMSERAFEDTLGRAAALSGGYTNSAALAAAAAAQNYYLSEFNDNIPQFFNNAYNRYLAENQEDRNRLSAILGTAGELYGTELNSALSLYDLINQANMQNTNRRWTESDIQYNRGQQEWQNQMAEEQWQYTLENDAWSKNMAEQEFVASLLTSMYGTKTMDPYTYRAAMQYLMGY